MTTSATTTRTVDWATQIADQMDFHWDVQLRPRLEGLTDDEYRWEPVPGCWSVRRRDEAVTAMAAGAGDRVIDFAFPVPDPAPVTTIAWRLGHLIVGVLGARNASHFGGPPMAYDTYDHPATASGALEALDAGRALWSAAVRALDDAALAAPCGEDEGPYADLPIAALVLHINREVIHHGAEICLLRDLYGAGADLMATRTKEDALMPVGQTKDVGWEIGVSRTLRCPAAEVWGLLTSPAGTELWLGSGLAWPATKGAAYELDDGTVGEVRGYRPLERIRLTWQPPDWDHESTVQFALSDQGDRTRLTFHQERLVDADERERQRHHWAAVMDQVEAALER